MKFVVKFALNSLAMAIVAPVWAAYIVAASIAGRDRVFPGASQVMSLLPGISGQYLRRAFYRLVLPRCGGHASIGFQSVFSHSSAQIGNDVYVGIGCMIGNATLENDVLIGSHVSIINGGRQHDTQRLDLPVRLQPGVYPQISVGEDSWIGDRAVVMANVGRHCIVGAGAVVTKPVPDFAIVAGNPARIIKSRRAAEENPSFCPEGNSRIHEVSVAPEHNMRAATHGAN